jgi:hypothetical protein
MRWFLLITIAGCGRIAFDPIDVPGPDAPGLDAPGAHLVAWYPMEDDPATGALVDASGNGHTALCGTGSPCVQSVAGQVGLAASFDGVTSDFLVADMPFRLPAFSVTLWQWRTMGGPLVSKPQALGVGASYELVANVNIMFCTDADPGPAGQDCTTGAPVPLMEWHHLAFTFDGVMKRAYVDAVLAGEWPAMIAYDSSVLVIGGDYENGAPTNHVTAILDELRFYDRALNASEIDALRGQ